MTDTSIPRTEEPTDEEATTRVESDGRRPGAPFPSDAADSADELFGGAR